MPSDALEGIADLAAGAIPKQKDRPKAVSPIDLASQALRISHSSAAPSNQSTECH